MFTIDTAMIKELRARTGAGLIDCKNALVEFSGDLNQAAASLREKGLSTAAGKASRIAGEGLVHAFVQPERRSGVLLEVNCETDFVAKTAMFKDFVQQTALTIAIKHPADLEELNRMALDNGEIIAEVVNSLITTLGEKIAIRRFAHFHVQDKGMIDYYIHEDSLTAGKLGVMLEIAVSHEQTVLHPEFSAFTKSLMLHIAAARPQYLDRNNVSANPAESEKFFLENCLLEQSYIKNPDQTIAELLQTMNDKFGQENIRIVQFVCFEKGEGPPKMW